MAEQESVCCGGCPFIQEMFSAETTILAARSGRSVTAVATHEANSGPSNRSAPGMSPVRNSSLAIWAALFDARTVIGTAIVSSGAGAGCCAAATLSDNPAASAKEAQRRRLFGPENIGNFGHPSLASSSSEMLLSNSQAVYSQSRLKWQPIAPPGFEVAQFTPHPNGRGCIDLALGGIGRRRGSVIGWPFAHVPRPDRADRTG